MQKITKYTNIINTISFFIMIITIIIISIITTDKDISKSEKRKLTQKPSITVESINNTSYMKSLEDYYLDQFPFRDKLRNIKTNFEISVLRKSDSGEYTQQNGHIYKVAYDENNETIDKTFTKIVNIANQLNTAQDKKIYYSIIPDKSYYNKKIPSLDIVDIVDRLIKLESDNIKYLDITESLSINDYYYTDIHWKQENIQKIADKILESFGKKQSNQEYSIETVTTEFNGSYGSASAFNTNLDSINILTNTELENIKVYDYELQSYIKVYNRQKAKGLDSYDVFLNGPRSLLRIENPNSKSKDKLLIFRDSFSSSLVPLLLSEYNEIILVDLRYINYNVVKAFVNLDEYNNVLFLYNMIVLNESKSFKF